MSNENWTDRLIDGLLRETVGGETPPNLKEKVMAKAYPKRRKKVIWAAGLAAAVVLAVCIIFVLSARYPAPHAAGDYSVAGGGPVERGAVLVTTDGSADLILGGYADVKMAPNSALKIEGDRFAEAVYLQSGEVSCDVEREKGTFKVASDIGTVSVSGTQFSVRLIKVEGGTDMSAKRMFVKVIAGAVIVAGSWGQSALSAGEEATLPKDQTTAIVDNAAPEALPEGLKGFSGQVRGVVVAKGEGNAFQFKVTELLRTWEGNKAETPKLIVGRTVVVRPRWTKREDGAWRPVEMHVAFIRKLTVGLETTLEIANQEGDAFNILELTKEQRAFATGGTTEGGADAEKRLNARVQELEKQVQQLKAENAELRRQLEAMRAEKAPK